MVVSSSQKVYYESRRIPPGTNPPYELFFSSKGNLFIRETKYHNQDDIIWTSDWDHPEENGPYTLQLSDDGCLSIVDKDGFQLWTTPYSDVASVSSPLKGYVRITSLKATLKDGGGNSFALLEGNVRLAIGQSIDRYGNLYDHVVWSSVKELILAKGGDFDKIDETDISHEEILLYETDKFAPYIMQLQSDGNLVIYRLDTLDEENIIWSSNTGGHQSSAPHTLRLLESGHCVLTDRDGVELWRRPLPKG
eukprot:CAMPEP_0184654906 /NCGR_PEP_ID=MMETSP0308-20130426/12541_1 /TAXON_ID=38269 /ORGANISM="Gloeochaete witrockiana, Strain SAG 46.84" /LENGTH=249 /DNA_ID=CAMNT_0027091103 /DNA_START=174 /DNA_END=923 /DNA_ORIENTATION=-